VVWLDSKAGVEGIMGNLFMKEKVWVDEEFKVVC
jgi:hypothetical protein